MGHSVDLVLDALGGEEWLKLVVGLESIETKELSRISYYGRCIVDHRLFLIILSMGKKLSICIDFRSTYVNLWADFTLPSDDSLANLSDISIMHVLSSSDSAGWSSGGSPVYTIYCNVDSHSIMPGYVRYGRAKLLEQFEQASGLCLNPWP